MLADFHVPKATTPKGLILDLLPRWHALCVPVEVAGLFRLRVELVGESAYDLAVDGPRLNARELGPCKALGDSLVRFESNPQPSASVHLQAQDVAFFLADWANEGLYRPRFTPQQTATVPTDPRILKRLLLIAGSFRLALRGVATESGVRDTEVIAVLGEAAKARLTADLRADITLSTSAAFYRRLLSGAFGPEEAFSHPDVQISGKRMLGLQAAFALAPWLPQANKQRAR
jgi:hypothetical protein